MKYQNNQHFSHHHILTQLTLLENEPIPCNMCNLEITEPFHGCLDCNHYLHESCLNTPRSLSHPAHSNHPLALHSTPTYPSRTFSCDACRSEGDGYMLCCAHCEFDLHLPCANSPLSTRVHNHPHDLKLLFDHSPFKSNKNVTTACGLCGGMINNKKHWVYMCDGLGCDFGVHIDCVNGKTRPKAANGTKMGERVEGSTLAVSSGVEDINAIAKAQQELYAAQAIAQIQLQANRAVVDSRSRHSYHAAPSEPTFPSRRHRHPLVALSNVAKGAEIRCNACVRLITEPRHGCNPCKFYLHGECMDSPRSLSPFPPLNPPPFSNILVPSFGCNACGGSGAAINFCCAHCQTLLD